MSTEDQCFKVLLKEEQDSGAELKFNLKASSNSGGAGQQKLIDADIGDDALVVLGDMIEVIHGTLNEGGSPATRIVMRFRFQPGDKNHRRFKSATIKMAFLKGDESVAGPKISKIAPNGVFSLFPSETQVETSHTVNANLQAGSAPVSATGGYAWQLKKNQTKESSARLTGAARALAPDRSRDNTAVWTLLENPETKSGIPTLLETAILLERNCAEGSSIGEKFKATLTIQGEVDWLTAMEDGPRRGLASLKGQDQKDEFVLFHDELGRGATKDLANLNEEDLDTFTKVVTLKTL